MGITGALNIASSGLRVAQDDLNVVASNVANSETEGFTRRRLIQSEVSADGGTIGVRSVTVERTVNEEVQDQLREFAAINVNNQIQSDFINRLDVAFGEPGSPTAIDTAFNQALSSLEALAASPEDFSAQIQAVTDLQVFTGQLNNLSSTVQDLRSEADIAIAETIAQANAAIEGIAELNTRIVAATGIDTQPVALLDERDRLIDELSQIIDIEVERNPNNTVQIRTTSGISLVESQPFFLEFDRAGTVTAETTLENGILSTIEVRSGGTFAIDLLATNQLQEGALAAYTELRDVVLQQVQSQLDEFAAQLALAVSNVDVPSTPITDGLEVDVNNIADGNTVSVDFTDSAGNPVSLTLVQVSDPTQLPLDDSFTGDPNDRVFGLDFNSPTAVSNLQAFLDGLTPASGLTAGLSGTSLQLTATVPATVDELSANITNPGLTNGLAFPLFIDGGTQGTFTNAINEGPGLAGFSQRIQVNSDVLEDPSLLSRFTSSTANAGNSDRVNFILDQIRDEVRTVSPSTGLGATSNPVQATSADLLQIIISRQGQQAEAIAREANASEIAFFNVQERFQAESSVNIDQEIARLIELEQAFQANARVLSTVQEIIDALLAI